jgi:hypothetical protein
MARLPLDPEYLREKARQFRQLAEGREAIYSPVLELADELDAMAAEIEKRRDPHH